MRTALIIVAGLVVLALAVFSAKMLSGTHAMATAAKIFISVWLAVAIVNLWIGVSRVGYTVAEELPILLVVFGIPAAAAAFVLWKLG